MCLVWYFFNVMYLVVSFILNNAYGGTFVYGYLNLNKLNLFFSAVLGYTLFKEIITFLNFKEDFLRARVMRVTVTRSKCRALKCRAPKCRRENVVSRNSIGFCRFS